MKSHISGIQVPTPARINIDGGLTLDSVAGTSGHMMISQGTGNTPIWSNTLTSPTIVTSLTTSSTSFDLLNTTATTINFGGAATSLSIGTSAASSATFNFATGAVTGSKIVNIGTNGAGGSGTSINIGSNTATASTTIYLQSSGIVLGQSRSSAAAVSGYSSTIYGPSASTSGVNVNATGGDLTIYSGSASITNSTPGSGVATSGNILIDSGPSSHAWFDGTTLPGNIAIGTTTANSTTLGRVGAPTIINGSTINHSGNFVNGITINANSAQFPTGLTITESTHSTSRRAAIQLGSLWQIGQDSTGTANSTGTRDFYIFGNGAQRLQIATDGTLTLTGGFVGPTTTTSLAPIRLPSGTVPSSANQQFGMVAAAAESLQLSTTKTTGAGPGFGFIRAPQMVYAVANSTAATSSTPVSPFAAANDVLSSLEVGKAYRFRGTYYLTSTFTSGSPAIQLAFAFSNAPVIFKYNYKTYRASGQASFDLVGQPSTNAATTVSAGVTSSTSYVVEFEGFFTSNATTASTLTPQFQMAAPGVSTVATAGSFFEVQKLGTSSQTLIAGNWA
jgi:hypothetical protein